MIPTPGGFAAFRAPVDREVFAPGFDLWQRFATPLRRIWQAIIRLPDRGRNAACPLMRAMPTAQRGAVAGRNRGHA